MTKKKLVAITFASVAMLAGAFTMATFLKQDYEMQFSVGKDEYTVNGTVKKFDEKTENLPLIDKWTGRLMLPLRIVMEEIGGSLEWEDEFQSTLISYKGTNVEIKESDVKASINGNSIVMDIAPKNIKGCLYVTADFISNNFGTKIEWQEDMNQIIIKTESIARPIVNTNLIEFDELSADYAVQIPVITGLNDKNYEQSLNNTLLSQSMEEITDFVEKSKKNKANLKENERFVWNEKIYVFSRRSELISLISDSVKTEPSNINQNSKRSINIDLQSQKFLKMDDLFKNQKYKTILMKEIENIKQNDTEQYQNVKINEITGDETFALGEEEFVLFLETETGSYARFEIPYENLRKTLKGSYGYLIPRVKK